MNLRSEGNTRRIGLGGLTAIFLVYLAVLQIVAKVASRNLEDVEYGGFYDTRTTWLTGTLAVLCSVVFIASVTTALGWWRPVWVDHRPAQRWTWWFVAIVIAAVAIGTNYPALADITGGHFALLVITVLLIGTGEEIMFRGIAVTAMRDLGWSETKVLVGSSCLFGLAHSTNIVLTGPRAILQVLITTAAGVFFYLMRRVSGSLLMPILMHALWDFGALSALLVRDETYAGAAIFLLADLAMGILVWTRWRDIEPANV